MNQRIPPARLRAGKKCECVCHRMPGVNHMLPCCWGEPGEDLKELQEAIEKEEKK